MARAVSEKVGRGPCPSRDCDDLVMYRKSSGGMLTHKCDSCDSSGYAPPGSTAYTHRMAGIEAHRGKGAAPAASAIPAPAPKPAAPAAAATAPKKPASVFNLSEL